MILGEVIDSVLEGEDVRISYWEDDSEMVLYEGNRDLCPNELDRCVVDELWAVGNVLHITVDEVNE